MTEPQPATRREFLHRGIGLLGFGATVPSFIAQSAFAMANKAAAAQTASRPGVPDDRILVIVQLAGGNDGLNTIVPIRNDDYYRSRPKLAIPRDKTLAISDELGWHPDATGFKSLWDSGQLCAVQGVGYPNPDRSHFVSTRIWATASPNGKLVDGWLGRYFDHTCRGTGSPDAKAGIALVDELPLTMRGQRFMPVCTARPEQFGLGGPKGRKDGMRKHGKRKKGPKKQKGDGQRKTGATHDPRADHSEQAPPGDSNLDFLRRSTLDAHACAKQVRAAARTTIDGAKFPDTRFARTLRSVARMIASDMPTKVYYVSLTGFDTHANQAPRHARLMKEGGSALAAFIDALRLTGDLDRTLVMSFSEFGRRVAENASGGTDHGQAAPMFLMGKAVKPGLVGATPSLTDLAGGDLKFHTDFRRIYATVLRDWLGTDPDPLLGGSLPSMSLLT